MQGSSSKYGKYLLQKPHGYTRFPTYDQYSPEIDKLGIIVRKHLQGRALLPFQCPLNSFFIQLCKAQQRFSRIPTLLGLPKPMKHCEHAGLYLHTSSVEPIRK
jgi:hypothetical protein